MNDHIDHVLESFRAKAARGDTSGIRVKMRMSGGMPGEQHLDRSVIIDEVGRVSVASIGDGAPETREASSELRREALTDVMRKLAEGVDGLSSRSQARFLPDSLVGSVTLEVDGEGTELFFLADEEERITQGKPIPPPAVEAFDDLRRIGERLLDQANRGGLM